MQMMAVDGNYEDPIKQVLDRGAPYPMVVLPSVDGDYWMEGNYHILSRDSNDRPMYPSIDMSRCTLVEDENIYKYRRNFAGREHANYAGEDMAHGPILMSVLLHLSVNDSVCDQFVVILRTKVKTMFNIIPANSLASEIPGPRDFMRYILGEEPEVDRFHPIALPRASDDVLHFDEHSITNCHKFGVLCQTFGQINEEDYLQNNGISPAFHEFIELIGEQVNLKDFPNYRGGLDVKYSQTGDYSYYTKLENREIMFHVSPLLPYTANDSQQLSRKRHIGNDVVSIIFQETNTPFCPSSIRSHVLHVFIVIQVEDPCSEDTCYKISVTAKEGVPKFAPALPNPCIFKKGPEFRKFLLTKLINGEAAALKCEKFSALAERTRSTLLEQVVAELIHKNERLLEDETLIESDLPQKTNSFLSTFRSAWHHRNARSTNNASNNSPSNEQLKSSKNYGQSLSLNDLSLLESEDVKKDIKISSKEKKRMKRKSHIGNNLVSLLKSQSFTIENNENSDKPVFYTEQFQFQCEVSSPPYSLPQHVSASVPRKTLPNLQTHHPKIHTSTSSPHRHNRSESENGMRFCSGNESRVEDSLALATAEVETLKAEVSKLKLDKMDLVRQNVIHQREIKKLNERYSSTHDDCSQLQRIRKEKRRSALLVTSTEFV